MERGVGEGHRPHRVEANAGAVGKRQQAEHTSPPVGPIDVAPTSRPSRTTATWVKAPVPVTSPTAHVPGMTRIRRVPRHLLTTWSEADDDCIDLHRSYRPPQFVTLTGATIGVPTTSWIW
jgi:hypothetical protein